MIATIAMNLAVILFEVLLVVFMSLLFAFDYMTNIRRLTTTQKDFR